LIADIRGMILTPHLAGLSREGTIRSVRILWAVIAVWGVLGVAAGVRARATPALLTGQGGSTLRSESRHAEDVLASRFARPVAEAFAVTVSAPVPFDRPGPRLVLDSLAAALGREPYVRGTLSAESIGDSALVSRDPRSTFLLVAFQAPADTLAALVQPVREVARRTLARLPHGAEYRVLVTGRTPLDHDERLLIADASRQSEIRVLPLTVVVLVLAFGAVGAAFLPVVIGLLGVLVALAVVGVVALRMEISVVAVTIVTMIGLGVGIDYSLLMVTRFREELAAGLSPVSAAGRTVLTAGRSVAISGVTVVLGFAALLPTPLVETRSVGLAGIVAVVVMLLLTVTLLPALLALLGERIDWPRWLARRLAWYHGRRLWVWWARTIGRRPGMTLLVGLVLLGMLVLPVRHIRIGLPARDWWPAATEAGQGAMVLERMGVGGVIQPIHVVIELPAGRHFSDATELRGLRTLSDSLRADPRVRSVKSIVALKPGMSLLAYSLLYSDLEAARKEYPDFLDAYLSHDAGAALVDVIVSDTTSLLSEMDVVHRVRELGTAGARGLAGARLSVGGYTAASVDFQRDLLGRVPLMIALILGSTGLVLAVVFRSVLIPIKAVVLNTLSVAATFGLIVLVFQDGFGSRLLGLSGPTEAIFVVVPVTVFAAVFGLSMDYEVFLLSRIREEFEKTGDNERATAEGLSAIASTITSAALIMVIVFGYFAFARVLLLQFLGFGLALAVFLDATLIRMLLVPTIMNVAGRWNWWPGGRDVRPR
jgi:putative drug exporter of the RND superfamily